MPTKTKKRKSAPRFTLKEREAVLKEALRLIRRPETWVKGKWKCELFQKKNGRVLFKNHEPIPFKDSRGRQVFAYCLEGAVNQAIVNVLGEKRAITLTAYYPGYADNIDDALSSSVPSKTISLTDLIMELYPKRLDFGEADANVFNDHKATKHEDVLKVLRLKLKDVRAELRARSK